MDRRRIDALLDRAKRLRRSGCVLILRDGRRVAANISDAICFLLSGELAAIEAADDPGDGHLGELIKQLIE